jgi:hypothetical protein
MTNPRDLKRLLSDELLGLPGIEGVGLPGGKLTVYLSVDSIVIRQRVIDLVNQVAPGTPVNFVTSDRFRPIGV